MTAHRLKCWPEPFEAMWQGKKTHELRKNDRDFQVGDQLELEEWNPETSKYSGRCMMLHVQYITFGGKFGLPSDMCIMSVVIESWISNPPHE